MTKYFRTSGVLSSTYVGVEYQPIVKLDFLSASKLDPRFSFTRASTATYINSVGNYVNAAANVPRIDHDPVTLERKGLLIEEPRTNLVYWSANPNQSTWENSGTITSTQLADVSVFTPARITAGASHLIWHRRQAAPSPLVASTKYTVTVLFKPGTSGNIYIAVYADGSNYFDVYGTVDNPVMGTTLGVTINTSHVIKVHKSGIYQLTVTFTPTSSLNYYIGVGPGNATTGQYIDFYGSQIEASQASTSFIVTGSTAGSLDKARDVCFMDNINSMLSGQATLMCESIVSSSANGGFIASLYTSPTNYAALGYINGVGSYVGVSYYNNGTFYNGDPPLEIAIVNSVSRIALAYDSAGAVTYYSGNKVAHTGTFPGAITPQYLHLGTRNTSEFDSNVWIRKLFLYDKKIDEDDMLFITRL